MLSLVRSADGRRATTGVLAEQLGLTQPTITHHLGALFDAGFVERERDGRQTWYWVNTDGVQAIRQLLDPEPEIVNAIEIVAPPLRRRTRSIVHA